ncbi:VanZ family protein [Carnobacteriaceae bacterium zg-ZUI252]|nr:VanZ family protein [Carnobacteriaceae bacterium zg-ZUI252]
MKKKQKENIAILVAIGIMVLLFISSSQPYEQQTAIPLLRQTLYFKPFESELRHIEFLYAGQLISVRELGYFEFVEFFIRKFAHFSTYFILGYSWLYALSGKIRDKKTALLVSLLLCVFYAAFDEFHQSLTPNRTPLLEDVLLDSFGSILGIGALYLTNAFRFKKRR